MKITLSLVLIVLSLWCKAQSALYQANVEAQASVMGKNVPFWMRSNQFGSIPLSGTSGSILAGGQKMYQSKDKKFFDWGASVQARTNFGKKAEFILLEGYGKIRLGILEVKGGRSRENFGLADTLLSSGNFAVSGNALGIPKLEISIPEFYSLPFAGKFFSFKGNYAHGWLGNVPIQFPYRQVDQAKTYLHQKSLYLRLGKPDAKTKVYLGLNDNVLWGNSKEIFSKNEFTLTPWQEYTYVILSKKFEYSQVGNHLGTVDLAVDHRFSQSTVRFYHQSYFDKDALKHFANISDGLTGISLTRKTESETFSVNRFVFEFLYTKNQAKNSVTSLQLLGYEDYYNNYIYTQGWSYKSVGLGTPFITSRNDVRNEIPKLANEYFSNNRLLAFHTGMQGTAGNWEYTTKLSYSMNYGTYSTEKSFGKKSQFSGYIEANRDIGNKLYLGLTAALDAGDLLNTTGGLLISLKKKF
ncbi:hypothetical protein DYBT9275_01625 [Dyadobacter sp. CECT 9275]|uniref:Capsule assembly protein Wzi n=1 Tax=Dyadobacter helix TaxID=2822344 RepID=A0A916JAE5_9BACT|nr:capsule assembly Wzi family protein [Dyadobacter sp. CECT 9275]CAG4995388.1 hypothetical protein DYBT9275_01625 [Dyadobacter sp. CECT 9275]